MPVHRRARWSSVIVDGLHRLSVAIIGVTTARDAFRLIAIKNMAITAGGPSSRPRQVDHRQAVLRMRHHR